MAQIFQGIDPYVEAQGYWPDFHHGFITYCREALADALPGSYEARVNEEMRVFSRGEEELALRKVIPDVGILRGAASEPAEATGSIATLEPVTVELPVIEEVRDAWIEIIRHPGRELVTVIELLSPSNKEQPGRDLYLAKRSALLVQQVHLVELDLLLGGRRLPMRRPLPQGDYYVLVSRHDRRPASEVYVWRRDDRLPTIPVPLKPPDSDVALDLAAVYRTAYDRGRYAKSIDYNQPIPSNL
ncbi:MAG: DUF4058 family protein [Pirellulales bacterium]